MERIKEDISGRFKNEIESKNQELLRTEGILNERISVLEREVSRLELQQTQGKAVESDLRSKNDLLNRKNEQLQLDLFQSGDSERKVAIELQLKCQHLESELSVKDQSFATQMMEVKTNLQTAIVDAERLRLEAQQKDERSKHALQLAEERKNLEIEKCRAAIDRQGRALEDRVKELTMDQEGLQNQLERSNNKLRETE